MGGRDFKDSAPVLGISCGHARLRIAFGIKIRNAITLTAAVSALHSCADISAHDIVGIIEGGMRKIGACLFFNGCAVLFVSSRLTEGRIPPRTERREAFALKGIV